VSSSSEISRKPIQRFWSSVQPRNIAAVNKSVSSAARRQGACRRQISTPTATGNASIRTPV
jgi:hypothetical protein